MARRLSTPYLQRRGHTWYARIAIPAALQHTFCRTELLQSLKTTDHRLAAAKALVLAGRAKQLFENMRNKKPTHQPQDDELSTNYGFELSFDEHGQPRITANAEPHETAELGIAISTTISALSAAGAIASSRHMRNTNGAEETPAKPQQGPTVGGVVKHFLDGYQQDKKSAMFKKHQAVLPMFSDIVGPNKPISELKQADINRFFDILHKLPPRWADKCRVQKKSVLELAETNTGEGISPKSFEDTYLACVRPFLKATKRDFLDQGFPPHLTTEGIEYRGDREAGENRQRAFKNGELARLFGSEWKAFARDKAQHHYYWLPLVGLFTGARVNEACQLNPQTDVLHDEETGIWYMLITEDTETDARVRKSVKNKTSWRKVPIHSTLIRLGFLGYAERMRAAGAKLLFPAWAPASEKASGNAVNRPGF